MLISRWDKYLLVRLDMFSGRIEVFLTSTKRAQIISDLLLWEIIPQFVIPPSLQSDNGIKFTFQFSQTLSKVLNIPWYFHVPYHTSPYERQKELTAPQKLYLLKCYRNFSLPLTPFRLWILFKLSFSISLFKVIYGQLFLTPYLPSESSPLPDHQLTPLLYHLHFLLWNFTPYFDPCPFSINTGVQVLLSHPD